MELSPPGRRVFRGVTCRAGVTLGVTPAIAVIPKGATAFERVRVSPRGGDSVRPQIHHAGFTCSGTTTRTCCATSACRNHTWRAWPRHRSGTRSAIAVLQMRHASRPPALTHRAGPREGMGLRILAGPHRVKHLRRGAVHRIATPQGCSLHRRAGRASAKGLVPRRSISRVRTALVAVRSRERNTTLGGTTDRIIRCRCCSAVHRGS